ncbi:uncharacterized protein LOC128202344 [Galleria mellonella]|uniref:Uncharacterized protein LOC128202344 n=1 Tax=Galleria mellonella TaxID=7137 RepID=A0ABM3N474_GALME|nr:uncharacterized protein LOC128202344 [Galleria mellonella]
MPINRTPVRRPINLPSDVSARRKEVSSPIEDIQSSLLSSPCPESSPSSTPTLRFEEDPFSPLMPTTSNNPPGSLFSSCPTTEQKPQPECLEKIQQLALSIASTLRFSKSVTAENRNKVIEIAHEIAKLASGTMAAQLEVATDTLDVLKREIGSVRADVMDIKNILTAGTSASADSHEGATIAGEVVEGVRKEIDKLVTYERALASCTTTYADKARIIPPKKPAASRPAIIVSSTDPAGSSAHYTLNTIRKKLLFRNIGYTPYRVATITQGRVRLEFDNTQQQKDTLERLKSIPELQAESVKKSLPLIILKGIHKDLPSTELIDTLLDQNPSVKEAATSETDAQLSFLKNNRNPVLYNAVLRVTSAIWRAIMTLERVNLDFQRVRVDNFSPFRQCFNCLKFGHTRAKCDAKDVCCSHCAGAHAINVCPVRNDNSKICCVNCNAYNQNTRAKVSTSHSATSSSCPRILAVRAQHELMQSFNSGNYDAALICEPYTGSRNFMGNPYDHHIFQYPSNSRVKACIVIKKGLISAIGLAEHSSANVCTIQVNTAGKKLFLSCVYLEPRYGNQADKHTTMTGPQALLKLEAFIRTTADAMHLICGDFNGWHTAWGSASVNSRGNEIMDFIIANDLIICNQGSEPTFTTTTHGQLRESIIDLTLATAGASPRIRNWQVNREICPSSDHHAVEFVYTIRGRELRCNQTTTTYRFNTNNIEWNNLKAPFMDHLIQTEITTQNVEAMNEEQLESFVVTFISAIQAACEKLLPRFRARAPRCPWWNNELQSKKLEVVKNHHLLQRLKRRGKPMEQALAEKNRLKEEYSKMFNEASTRHFRQFCAQQGKEDVWAVTNRIIKSVPAPQPPSTLRLPDGTYTQNSVETAKVLLDRFFPDDTPDTREIHGVRRIESKYEPHTEPEPRYTTDEVHRAISEMSPRKAPGPDHLTADICQFVVECFPELVTSIMNRCLTLGYFPRIWKSAIIKLIPKSGGGDFSDLSSSSFRPIGLLNLFGKLLEKLTIGRLSFHMHANNNFNPNQYGFKSQTSTVNALYDAIDHIRQGIASGHQVAAVSLDIKAAFDNAWWPLILCRLQRIGCPSNIYRLMASYLEDRIATFNYADTSINKLLTRGCIQGSVCGPFLWNLILDELLEMELPIGCRLQAYADDVLLVATAKNESKLQEIINTALEQIQEWGLDAKLTFNPVKTQAVAFTTRAARCNLFMNAHPIQFHDYIKILGIKIDRRLKFTHHVNHIINKAKKLFSKLIIFTRPTWGICSENIKIIYNQVIQPIICYGASIWHSALEYKFCQKKLISLQRGFAVRIVRGFRTLSTEVAIILAQLTPICSKVEEVAEIERTRVTRATKILPDAIQWDSPAPISDLLHPALRKKISFAEVTSTEELTTFLDPQCYAVYTDGSKRERRAELLAIKHACEWVLKGEHTPAVVMSDSKSSLMEISNPNSTNSLVVDIHASLHEADSRGLTISFAWLRSHVGIDGNEAADTAARAAAVGRSATAFSLFPMSYVKHHYQTLGKDAERRMFEDPNKCCHLKKWCPSFDILQEVLSALDAVLRATDYGVATVARNRKWSYSPASQDFCQTR